MSLREKLLGVKPATRVESVTVPVWGSVLVRGLTGAEWDEYEAVCAKGKGGKGKAGKSYVANRHILVRLAVVDGDGSQVFGEGDESQLATYPAEILNPIARVASRLSGLGDDPGND